MKHIIRWMTPGMTRSPSATYVASTYAMTREEQVERIASLVAQGFRYWLHAVPTWTKGALCGASLGAWNGGDLYQAPPDQLPPNTLRCPKCEELWVGGDVPTIPRTTGISITPEGLVSVEVEDGWCGAPPAMS